LFIWLICNALFLISKLKIIPKLFSQSVNFLFNSDILGLFLALSISLTRSARFSCVPKEAAGSLFFYLSGSLLFFKRYGGAFRKALNV